VVNIKKDTKKKMIIFIGKDGSRWPFEQLTGLPHPNTNDDKMLKIMAQAAIETDPTIERYVIVEV